MSKRGDLLKAFSEKNISIDTMLQCSGRMKNMTDKQKEECASQMLSVLNRSKDEQSFISAMKNMNLI